MVEKTPRIFDDRPGIFLAHEMPENIKIASLSDAAFRILITAWCYCSRVRSDGMIPDRVWRTMGTAKARQELMTPPAVAPDRAPLVEQVAGGVCCHDYLKHNRSAREIEEFSSRRSQASLAANHRRWHVRRNRWDENCELCCAEGTR